MPKDFLNLSRK